MWSLCSCEPLNRKCILYERSVIVMLREGKSFVMFCGEDKLKCPIDNNSFYVVLLRGIPSVVMCVSKSVKINPFYMYFYYAYLCAHILFLVMLHRLIRFGPAL